MKSYLFLDTVCISFYQYNRKKIRVKHTQNHSIDVTGKGIKSPWSLETNEDDRRPQSKTDHAYLSLDP